MPAPETAFRRQKAILWPKVDGVAGYDDYGQPTVRADPEELFVRWVWRQSLMTGKDGTSIPIDATVVVDRDVELGSLMWEGELADWYGTGSQFGDDALMEVVATKTTPDLKARSTRRTLGLVFYKDTMPNG